MKTKMQRIAMAVVTVMVVQGVLPNTDSYASVRPSDGVGALSLPDGRVGESYEYQLRTEGGLSPLTWKVVGGELPSGISLEASGKLKGEPITPRPSAYAFAVEVSDSSPTPQRLVQPLLLVIQAAPLRIVPIAPNVKNLPPSEARISSPYAPNLKPVSHVRTSDSPANSAGTRASGDSARVSGQAASDAAPGNPVERNTEDPKPSKTAQAKVSGTVTLASVKRESKRRGQGNTYEAELKAAPPESLDATRKKQKLFVENYLDNLVVQAQAEDGSLLATALTNSDGFYTLQIQFDPSKGKVTVSTEADDYTTRRTVLITEGGDIQVDIPIEDRPVSLLQRAVIGFSQSGASSAKSDQNYFFNLFVSKSLPFTQKVDPNFGERWKAWGDIRIASAPQQITSGVGAFATGFVQNAANVPVNKVARALEFLTGIEVRVLENNALLPSFDRQTKQKFSLSLVAGFGATTPTDPKETLEIFKVAANAPGLPPAARDKEFVAFVTSDRDRFFRQYYVGFRINTFFFNQHDIPLQRFPAMLDVMYGQNEFVTGGRLRGGVVRIDSYFPLPYEGMKFINLFGTAFLRPGRTNITTPLILEPAPDGTKVPALNVELVATPQTKRDYYRVGVGIDFISFVQTLKNLNKKP